MKLVHTLTAAVHTILVFFHWLCRVIARVFRVYFTYHFFMVVGALPYVFPHSFILFRERHLLDSANTRKMRNFDSLCRCCISTMSTRRSLHLLLALLCLLYDICSLVSKKSLDLFSTESCAQSKVKIVKWRLNFKSPPVPRQNYKLCLKE